MIKLLFPEYKFILIKKNGIVKLRRYWFSLFICKSIHISELCITEIPIKLSNFRQGDNKYTPTYKEYLNDIIGNNLCNVIDWLYQEFLKIKKNSKIEVVSLSRKDDPKYETIDNIINKNKSTKKSKVRINLRKIKEIQKMYNSLLKDSKFSKFILAQ